jgi:hypothetical protein
MHTYMYHPSIHPSFAKGCVINHAVPYWNTLKKPKFDSSRTINDTSCVYGKCFAILTDCAFFLQRLELMLRCHADVSCLCSWRSEGPGGRGGGSWICKMPSDWPLLIDTVRTRINDVVCVGFQEIGFCPFQFQRLATAMQDTVPAYVLMHEQILRTVYWVSILVMFVCVTENVLILQYETSICHFPAIY